MRRTILLGGVFLLAGVWATLALAQTKPAATIPDELKKPRFQIRRVLDADDKSPAVVAPGRDDRTGQDGWRLGKDILIEGKDVASARVAKDPNSDQPLVSFQLNKQGAEKFAQVSRDNLKKRLAMLVDGQVLVAPTVQSPITGGAGQISFGRGTKSEEAEGVAQALRSEAQGQPLPPKWQYAPVREAALHDIGAGGDGWIDFDTGRQFTMQDAVTIPAATAPAATVPGTAPPAPARSSWLPKPNMDAMANIDPSTRGLFGIEMIAVPMPNDFWDRGPEVVADILAQGERLLKPGTPANLIGKGDLPATYIIKTRQGRMGILQIVGFEDQPPKAVKIRYKLLEPGGTTHPATATAPVPATTPAK